MAQQLRDGTPAEWLAINTLRTLAMDAVEKAQSGHPGTPMGLAPLGYVLWQEYLHCDPADPLWPNRDRFVLSAGHASMLLYGLLHLAGVRAVGPDQVALDEPAVSLDDIRQFRQLGSKCPGHPEYGLVPGVEATTGPLGQGCANSVGMAIAARWLASRYNRPEFAIFDYDVYALCGDGDQMEGISAEAASLAGHLQLDRLCWIYDSNRISIEGSTDLAFTEDVAARFVAYGWHVAQVADANDLPAIRAALDGFKRGGRAKPSLIVVHSHIGYGAPHRQDTKEAHGEPLGTAEVRLAKQHYGWDPDAQFLVPDGVRGHFTAGIGARGRDLNAKWQEQIARYAQAFPDLADQIQTMQHRALPSDWDADLPIFPSDPKGLASRDASGKVLNRLAQRVPWLVGGAADLSPSTKTHLGFEAAGEQEAATPSGRNLHFGVREHAMGAIVNGLTLTKLRAYGATFLVFSDYQKPAIRLSALMAIPAIHIFTHDSIGLGEDGPTHQPIEHLAALRAIPGLVVLRPCDANEVVEAWRTILQLRDKPVALCLSRQPLPTLDRTRYADASGLRQGAYILAEAQGGAPEVILMATGSEVKLALDARDELQQQGVRTRVVSMPSWELFAEQTVAYQRSVLPPEIVARVSVEAGATLGWERFVGLDGIAIGMTTFGASAPIGDLLPHFGFTVAHVVAAAQQVLGVA
jgi:transketolase